MPLSQPAEWSTVSFQNPASSILQGCIMHSIHTLLDAVLQTLRTSENRQANFIRPFLLSPFLLHRFRQENW